MVRGGANHEWQLMCQLLFMIGLANSALFAGFRPMLSSEPEAVSSTAYRTVLYSTVQYCTVLYSTVQYYRKGQLFIFFMGDSFKRVCVPKIGFRLKLEKFV